LSKADTVKLVDEKLSLPVHKVKGFETAARSSEVLQTVGRGPESLTLLIIIFSFQMIYFNYFAIKKKKKV
jgi:hypothetical protein